MFLFIRLGVVTAFVLQQRFVIYCQAEEFVAGSPSSSSTVLQKKWGLYHSVGGSNSNNEEWIRRGTVSLSIDPDEVVSSPITGDEKKRGDNNLGSIRLQVLNDEGCLSPVALQSLQESQWYKLKLEEEDELSNGENPPLPVITTVSACQLRRANFRDELVLTFGRMGHVVSMAYIPLISPLAPKTCNELPPLAASDDNKGIEFTSRISYETAIQGMTLKAILPNYSPPPGLKMISKKKTVSSTATKEAPGDKTSSSSGESSNPFGADDDQDKKGSEDQFDASPLGFLKRYWYIILPLMIINFMGKPEEPAEQQQGQPAVGAAATSAAPAATVQKQPQDTAARASKRRGKRSTN
ncbi:hypothetical protein ACA910_021516 [Epithemia clementina (nom. ined.)]